ncbi:hypothetical protein ACFO1B_03380 [Dactylosporangium siamense]|uniref:Uncharacterized protein n=1 Tax=Dactylosporangium siamense TaxID=685454 RepID=A0A919U9Y1_9ACTN|nr:hypothetical protein [Dactylosporangium siamense]GIG43078.1 hypothetical protein Dsi01nite_011190 [Dactylosporangium siamense]
MHDRLSVRWRQGLSAAGIAVGLLPLVQGEWRTALVAAVLGQIVVGVWAWGTGFGPVVGITVGAVLATGLAAAFAVSQRPRAGLLLPPAEDYLVVWVAVGLVAVAAVLVEGLTRGLKRAGWAVLGAALVLLPCACCTQTFSRIDEDSWRFLVRDQEILPLPPTFQLAWGDRCASGGTSGNCTAEFVVTATDGAARTVMIERLADHLSTLGWRMETDSGGPRGRFAVGGILAWREHKLWFSDETAHRRRPAPAGSVVIFIDNG